MSRQYIRPVDLPNTFWVFLTNKLKNTIYSKTKDEARANDVAEETIYIFLKELRDHEVIEVRNNLPDEQSSNLRYIKSPDERKYYFVDYKSPVEAWCHTVANRRLLDLYRLKDENNEGYHEDEDEECIPTLHITSRTSSQRDPEQILIAKEVLEIFELASLKTFDSYYAEYLISTPIVFQLQHNNKDDEALPYYATCFLDTGMRDKLDNHNYQDGNYKKLPLKRLCEINNLIYPAIETEKGMKISDLYSELNVYRHCVIDHVKKTYSTVKPASSEYIIFEE